MKSKYKHIFEPFTIKHMTVKNRIVMTPMGTNYGEQNGEMSFLTHQLLRAASKRRYRTSHSRERQRMILHRDQTAPHSFASITIAIIPRLISNFAKQYTNMEPA